MYEKLLTGEEVARLLNVSTTRVRQLALNGVLSRARKKIGRAFLYHKDDIWKIVQARREKFLKGQSNKEKRERGRNVNEPLEDEFYRDDYFTPVECGPGESISVVVEPVAEVPDGQEDDVG